MSLPSLPPNHPAMHLPTCRDDYCPGCAPGMETQALLGVVGPKEMVDHPDHYGGADDPYEVIKVLEAWDLTSDAYLFNVVKYLARAGKKGDALEDHKKARWYLDRKIQRLEGAL